MERLTDISTIKDVMERHGFTFSKALGQNFLINPSVCPRMAEAAIGEHNQETSVGVLEIGPGIGVLTKELLQRADKVVAVELDKRLLPVLDETLGEFDNLKVVNADVLELDLHKLIAKEFPGMRVVVCANLPYYITSPILMALLEQHLPIENITVLVQKEAAERISARPGTRQSGAISCAVEYYAKPKMLFNVQPGSFYPAPKVVSSVIRLDIRPTPAVQVPDEKAYFALVRAAFGQRRKTAANAITNGLHLPKEQVNAAITAAGFDVRVRPEQLTLQDFAAIRAALDNGMWSV